MKNKIRHISIALIMMFCLSIGAAALIERPANMYVGDYAGVLSEDTVDYIVSKNDELFNSTGAEIVVVTVDFIDGYDIEDYCYDVFNDWGIGDKERNNGLLILLAINEDNYYALQGAGIEDALSASTIGDILYKYLEDDFAAGDYNAGVKKVFDAFLEWFQKYYSEGTPAPDYSYGDQYYDDYGYEEGYNSRGRRVSMFPVIFILILFIIIWSNVIEPIRLMIYRSRYMMGGIMPTVMYRPFFFGRPFIPTNDYIERKMRHFKGNGHGGDHHHHGGGSFGGGHHSSGGGFGGGHSGGGGFSHGGGSRGGGAGRR